MVAALEYGDRIVISNEKRSPRGLAGLSWMIRVYGKEEWVVLTGRCPPVPRAQKLVPAAAEGLGTLTNVRHNDQSKLAVLRW